VDPEKISGVKERLAEKNVRCYNIKCTKSDSKPLSLRARDSFEGRMSMLQADFNGHESC
jgi:hypothetical protein